MSKRRLSMIAIAMLVFAIGGARTAHGATLAAKCEAAKLKAAGKYAFCRLSAQKKAVLTLLPVDYSKCDLKYGTAWAKAELKYGVQCPTSGDQTSMQTDVTAYTACVGSDLGGAPSTCHGPPPPLVTKQTTSYGSDSDGASQRGSAHSYTDNGDGTITDNVTGLMWEKKDQAGGIHDWSNTYDWGITSPPYTMNGTVVSTFLATLNTPSCFAGFCDWRIPNVNELHTLENYENASPTVDTAFNTGCAATCTVLTCSCTQSDYYWSSTTYPTNPIGAFLVNFNDGSVDAGLKTATGFARAVRGGP